jgi:endo-1,4-beta-xylanase
MQENPAASPGPYDEKETLMETNKNTTVIKLAALMILSALLFSSLNLTANAAPNSVPGGQRLRALAGSFLIGYASMNNFWSVSDAAQYQEVARTEFNFMTPENAMKWDATEPSQNNFTFSQADQHVSFAQNNGMRIHGHTLVWHGQLPGWVANGSWNSTTLTNVMYNHIDRVMNHWSDGQIYAWDVVNEAFNENGTRRASVFQNVIGSSYIELAFRRARAADPLAKLIYNDYNVETVNSKSTAMYNMVADFKNRGVPIDGVGLQMHLSSGGLDYNSLAQNMQRFANIGVEVYITEMDVGISSTSQSNLQAQANVYSNVLARCKAQPACKALQVWGIPDKYSWRTGENPLLFDNNYNAKPAYYAIQAGLGGTQPTPTPTPSSNFLTNADMESGTTGWTVFGSGTLSSDTTQFHGGARSLKISGRTAAWNGIAQNVAVANFPTSGQNYTVSVWVRSQSGTPTARATLRLTAGSTTTFITMASAGVNASGWTLLSGTRSVTWSGTLTGVLFYVETAAGTDNLYIDDALLRR